MATLTESLNVIERSSALYLHSFVLKKKTRLDIFLFSTLFVRFLFVSFFLFCDADTESIRVFYLENVGMKWDQTSIEHLLNEMMKTNIR